jgi:uncharacterized protein (TIGR01319 family)
MVNAESLLAIDVGTVNTRVFLFDVTEGAYRFVSSGVAATTLEGTVNGIGEGVHLAIERLQEVTGRVFISSDGHLIVPSQPDGTGVDKVVATLSAGASVQVVLVGLLPDVSLDSAQRLVATTYSRVAEVISLNDRRKMEAQIDAVIRAQPDVVVLAGGTESGASRSVEKLIEVVGLACYALPADKRPVVIYSGNKVLADEARSKLEPLTRVLISPNIRPSFSEENINPAQDQLLEAVSQIRLRQVAGLGDLTALVTGQVMPTATSFGRIIRFLSQAYEPGKGVLGVDLGGYSTTVVAGFGGNLSLSVSPNLGMGDGLPGALASITAEETARWMPIQVPADYITEYLYNKQAHPASIPAAVEDLAIEQAVARLVLRQALKLATLRHPGIAFNPASGLGVQYEPILAAGMSISQTPTPGQAMLMLLDALQPVGVTTLVLDQNNLTAAIGAAALINTLLPVQVLESPAFLNLGTVISPISGGRAGAMILRARLFAPDGSETQFEIKQGTLTVLPLPHGQKARLQLDPSHDTDLGLNRPGRSLKLNVVGGMLGIVIDARGRPLDLPDDLVKRRDLFKKWLWTLGG